MSLPKITVVGAGNVGATAAHLLALKNLGDITLIDIVDGVPQGKALDIQSSSPLEGFTARVTGSTNMDDLAGSALIIVTAGMPRKPGMSRDDLLAANANIIGPIAEKAGKLAPDAVLMIVTNPLDVMVALALEKSGFPKERVMGMAGVLDSARLRTFIALRLDADPNKVDAMILGSHGDLMVPIKSSITVDGKLLSDLLPDDEINGMLDRAKQGGAEIVKLLKTGSAYYAPASGAVQMAESILKDKKQILPVCAELNGEYGISDVCLGVPAELGKGGIERIVEQPINEQEQAELKASAEQVREMVSALKNIQAKA